MSPPSVLGAQGHGHGSTASPKALCWGPDLQNLRMWLYLETGLQKGGSGKMRSLGWGPDPTGLGSLQEEEVRTQTHSATTL